MIVKCKDGFYYKNPSWFDGRMVVQAILDVEVLYRGNKPITASTLLRRAGKLGVFLGLPVPLGWEPTYSIFEAKMVPALSCKVTLSTCPKPPPSCAARFEIRPDDVEDEIIDDFSRKAIHGRLEICRG